MKARGRYQGTSCGTCGGRSCNGTEFFPSTSALPYQYHSTSTQELQLYPISIILPVLKNFDFTLSVSFYQYSRTSAVPYQYHSTSTQELRLYPISIIPPVLKNFDFTLSVSFHQYSIYIYSPITTLYNLSS
jgi:hypothetical protein